MREVMYRELGRRIRARREALGLSQAELGARLRPDQTRASIANIEAGKQRVMLHTIPALARALRWTPRKLMQW
jgi:transcriptional regulator with XRE-family HTH domain